MSIAADMTVTLRLPTSTLFQGRATRLTGVGKNGAFGLLPNHIDFVTALAPSVMTLRLADGSEKIFGIDQGLLVKKGHAIDVVTLRGVCGDDLSSLKDTIHAKFVQMDEEERQARSALSRLEAGIMRQFAGLQRPRS